MVDLVEGHELLEGVFFQVDVIERKIHIAHRADHGGILLLRRKERGELRVGLLQFPLRFQLPDLCFIDGLRGEDHMAQPAILIPVALNKAALSPVSPSRVGNDGALILLGYDTAAAQSFLQCGQVRKLEHFIRKFRRDHIPAEIDQPLLGIAFRPDMRTHIR